MYLKPDAQNANCENSTFLKKKKIKKNPFET